MSNVNKKSVPPEAFVALIRQTMIEHGPDGHCDGAEEIAVIAWKAARTDVVKERDNLKKERAMWLTGAGRVSVDADQLREELRAVMKERDELQAKYLRAVLDAGTAKSVHRTVSAERDELQRLLDQVYGRQNG